MSTHGRTTRRFRRLAAQLRAQRHQCWNYPTCPGIDYGAPRGHPRAFTADHIRPLSEFPDGAEDPANLRASCHGCNASRGTGQPRGQTPTPLQPDDLVNRHNYSPEAGGPVSRDWNHDWVTNRWHQANPTTPCVCRTVPQERTYSP
ncbi:HNH endonuclease [Nocardioides sp. Bht2]|uniref:HNH endonuclease n=1 Tax=Nocardioides sp. Bht2 TaxID=3392297 RepID=UPI0039B674A1